MRFVFQIVDGKCRKAYSWPNDVTAAAVGIFNLFLPFLVTVYYFGVLLWKNCVDAIKENKYQIK